MRRAYLATIFLAFLFCTSQLRAQIQAVTNTGETVNLHENGTWEYTSKAAKEKETLVNANKFTKHPNANFQVKSKRTGYAVFIDPAKWKFEKKSANDDDEAEYAFTLKDGTVYAMMVTEKVELSFELLKKASIVNASKVAPDARITEEEYRTVNGIKILMLQLKGTIDGLAFTYYGYYVTGETGTVQLITFTTSKLFEEQKKEMETFLNGLSLHENLTTLPLKL